MSLMQFLLHYSQSPHPSNYIGSGSTNLALLSPPLRSDVFNALPKECPKRSRTYFSCLSAVSKLAIGAEDLKLILPVLASISLPPKRRVRNLHLKRRTFL